MAVINKDFYFIFLRISLLVPVMERIARGFQSARQLNLSQILFIRMRQMIVTVQQMHVDLKLNCSICLKDFILDETVCKTLCNHLFHTKCFANWFGENRTHPLCRTHCLIIDVKSIEPFFPRKNLLI